MKEQLLLASYLKTLKLPTMLAQYAEVARQCAEADASYEEHLSGGPGTTPGAASGGPHRPLPIAGVFCFNGFGTKPRVGLSNGLLGG